MRTEAPAAVGSEWRIKLAADRRLVELVSRFRLENFVVPLSLEATPGFGERWPHVTLKMKVLDRDTGKPATVASVESYMEWDLREEDYVFDRIRRMICRALTHEVEECILVDGERRYDPHKGERD